MMERAIAFGRDGALVGVVTEPDRRKALAGAPAILMWNVGIQHRVGPYRIQVDLARNLAQRGFACLRFDLSGMGDSAIQHGGQLDHVRALEDARQAMAVVEKRFGITTFCPIGFCSSVDSAHRLALEDTRVVGACFLEGYAYHTPGYWKRYPLRLLDRQRWKRFASRNTVAAAALFRRRAAVNPAEGERAVMGSVFARQYPTRAQFAADVATMAAKGVRMLFVYVGGDTDFNHAGQFEAMVGRRRLDDRVDVEYYGDADHTFFRVADRERVVRGVGDWAERQFAMRKAEVEAPNGALTAGARGQPTGERAVSR